MNQITFPIGGMRCTSCASRVTSAIEAIDGIQSAKVTLTPPSATITVSQSAITGMHASPELRSKISEAIAAAGDYSISGDEISGDCSITGGSLEKATEAAEETTAAVESESSFLATYQPLILLVGFLILTCALTQWRLGSWSVREFAADFMGGFFLAFAFFKLLDWSGFARSFAMYDILARRSTAYARAYPILEVALGIAYLVRWQPRFTNCVTLVVMAVGSIGVWQAVRAKQKIQCACLGTVFDLPMSVVTVIENGTMALMAIAMLLS